MMFDRSDVQALASRIVEYVDWRRTHPGLGARCRAKVQSAFDSRRMVDDIAGRFGSLGGAER